MRAGRIERASLYSEVTNRIIAELEEGRLPWVQPWDSAACGCTMPQNAGTARRYSGINVLILWAEVVAKGYASQRWLTYRQAETAGGNVRRGEKGTVICYADRFTPKAEAEAARGEDRQARQVAFLKRFVVFNIDQCEGLPDDHMVPMVSPDPVLANCEADALIEASGARVNIGGGEAFTARAMILWLCRRRPPFTNRSIGIVPRSTSLAIGRVMAAGWTATRRAGSARKPTPGKSLSPRWRRRSPARRSASHPPSGIRIISRHGCRCCTMTKRLSFGPRAKPARRAIICSPSREATNERPQVARGAAATLARRACR